MNSYFLSKLNTIDVKDQASPNILHKWSNHCLMAPRHFIFVPLNQSVHWSLFLIVGLDKIFGSSERRTTSSTLPSGIYYLDSLCAGEDNEANLPMNIRNLRNRLYLWLNWELKIHREVKQSAFESRSESNFEFNTDTFQLYRPAGKV